MKMIKFRNEDLIKTICLSVMMLLLLAKVTYAADLNMNYTVNDTSKVSKNGTRNVTITASNVLTDKSITLNKFTISNDCDFYMAVGTEITTFANASLAASETNVNILENIPIIYKGTGNSFKYALTYTVSGESPKTENFKYTGISVNPEKEVVYETEYIESDSSEKRPNISITTPSNMDLNVVPGTTFNLKLVVKNTTGYRAKDVTISAEIDNSILSWEEYKGNVNLGIFGGNNTKNLELKLKINPNAKRGVFAIPIKARYTNSSGNEYTSDTNIYLNVTNELRQPSIELTSAIYPSEGIVPGEDFDLVLNFVNRGGTKAENVKIKLTNLSRDGFYPQNVTDTQYVNSINASSIASVTFPLVTSTSIPRGINELNCTITYQDETQKEYSEEATAYLKVGKNSSGLSLQSKPKIIISNYNISETPVKSGKIVNLTYTFLNTNTSKNISNIKVTVASEDGTFNIVNGSNSYWVENLDAKEKLTKSIMLRARNDAKSNSYPVSIMFDYEDSTGDNYSSVEEIYIQVVEDLKLQINEIELPYDAIVGSTTSISFSFLNLGKSTISNMRVEVEGDFESENEVNYLGNIDSGDEDYGDVVIRCQKEGDCHGKLIFIYEDTNGDEMFQEKEFNIYVNEQMNFQDDFSNYIPEVEEKKGIARWCFALFILPFTIAVVAFVTKTILMIIHNKKIEDEI